MFRIGSMHARDNGLEYPVLSQNVLLGTGTYYMPVGLSIRPNRNRISPLPKGIDPGDYGTFGRRTGE